MGMGVRVSLWALIKTKDKKMVKILEEQWRNGGWVYSFIAANENAYDDPNSLSEHIENWEMGARDDGYDENIINQEEHVDGNCVELEYADGMRMRFTVIDEKQVFEILNKEAKKKRK